MPTLNEEANLARLLRSLAEQTRPAERILISDGGSSDGTSEIARTAGVQFVPAPSRGRGDQIAAALEMCSESVVLVAHADMVLPSDALQRLQAAMIQYPNAPGGCLGHRFARTSLALSIVETWDRFRARRLGVSYGDQAQFFRRGTLTNAGGFPCQPLMEDLELSHRLKRLGRPIYLDCPVLASARRFETLGLMKAGLLNFALRQTYRLWGVAATRRLYRWYYGS